MVLLEKQGRGEGKRGGRSPGETRKHRQSRRGTAVTRADDWLHVVVVIDSV